MITILHKSTMDNSIQYMAWGNCPVSKSLGLLMCVGGGGERGGGCLQKLGRVHYLGYTSIYLTLGGSMAMSPQN